MRRARRGAAGAGERLALAAPDRWVPYAARPCGAGVSGTRNSVIRGCLSPSPLLAIAKDFVEEPAGGRSEKRSGGGRWATMAAQEGQKRRRMRQQQSTAAVPLTTLTNYQAGLGDRSI